jgi:hypothetical protein
MALIAECPSCGKKLKVPDTLVGREVRCADCAGTFVAERSRPAAPPPRFRRQPDEDDDDDDRPSRSRSRRRGAGDNYAPHRGGMVMALGIIGLVIILLEIVGYLVFLPVGIPLSIVGLVLGIMAWVMGGNDLKQMNAGTIDPDGRGMTMGGYVCGIIGTVLRIAELVCTCVGVVIGLIFFFGTFAALLGFAASMPTAPVGPPNAPRPPRQQFDAGPPLKVVDFLPAR